MFFSVTPVKPLEKETPVITDKREEKLISVKDETPIIDKNEEPAVLAKEVKVLQTDDKVYYFKMNKDYSA